MKRSNKWRPEVNYIRKLVTKQAAAVNRSFYVAAFVYQFGIIMSLVMALATMVAGARPELNFESPFIAESSHILYRLFSSLHI